MEREKYRYREKRAKGREMGRETNMLKFGFYLDVKSAKKINVL